MLTLVTGNEEKAKRIQKELGLPLAHTALDLYEIQSLDTREIIEAKAREAFARVGSPVLVDDSSLVIDELGGLPGPFVKWFEKGIGNEGICRFADLSKTRTATVAVGIGYFDGETFVPFIGEVHGTISEHPKGSGGFGWDAVFIHEGDTRTRAELSEEEREKTSARRTLLENLRTYLTKNS